MKSPVARAYEETASFLGSTRRPLLLSHARPDGDAIGSLIALRAMLRANGAAPVALLFDAVPPRYAPTFCEELFPVLGRDLDATRLDAFDGVVLLDTCTYSQLEPAADWLRGARVPKLAIDHHVTRDPLADRYLIDEEAAATCLILFELASVARWRLDSTTKKALFVGLATDTGWFRHSNTGARVFAAAAELCAQGVVSHKVYEELYLRDSAARVRLLGAAVASLELLHSGRLAVMTLTGADFARCDAEMADTEEIVNEPLRIKSVRASALIVEDKNGVTRVNLRSKPASTDADVEIDVAEIARSLGGGGHARAAGVRLKESVSSARDRIAAKFSGLSDSV